MRTNGKIKSLTKPGAERRGYVEDRIADFVVDADTTLLPFLSTALAQRKKTTIKNLLRYGSVAVNGTPVTQFDVALKPGDKVSVNFTRPFVVFRNRRVKLLYEDDDIIVIDKGYGLLSVGTGKAAEETAYSIIKDYIKRQNPSNMLFIIHRLDRDTSGLMMFAKNEEAKEIMQHNWNNMVLNRKYIAVVEGTPKNTEGAIRSYLKQNSGMEVYSVAEPEEGAQLAVTRYKVLGSTGGYTTMELELDTGRKNQIRVHMKDIGTPVAGDRKYGAHRSPYNRMALHAHTLRFIHPITRKEMSFISPSPFARR